MEDQSTDSGHLTDDAASAPVPQGKAARTRHRLPRRLAGQGEGVGAEDSADETQVPEAEDTPADDAVSTPVVEPAGPDSPEPTEPEPTETVVEPVAAEPVKARRRRAWRRQRDDTPPSSPGEAQEPAPEPVLVPHRPAGRWLKYAAVLAAILFVAAGAFAGASVQPYLADRAAVHTKFEIAETAASAITTLWTYTPEDMDQLPERSARFLGGDFAADYRRYIDAIAAPNKQAQVTNNTQVLGAAVESLTPAEATAIVYTNSVATSPVTKGIPSLRYLSYRLTMKRDQDRWLITQMVAVTKLDLTPRL